MGIAINRDAPLKSNIPTQPGSFFRGLGAAGLQDYLSEGVIRPNPAANYEQAYFSKDNPLDRYTGAAREQGSYIAESNSPNIQQQKNGYYGARQLAKNDPYTIWKRVAPQTYEKFYQNVPTEMLRRTTGALGTLFNKATLPMQIGEAVWNATEDARNRAAYQQRRQEIGNIPSNTEIRNLPR